jgi:hypothetical protein
MPVAQSRGHAGKALLISAVGVVILLGSLFLVAHLASKGDVTINLGDQRFDAGKVTNIATAIQRGNGLPILYQDLVGKNRNLFVQHEGTDPAKGWVAFGAFNPDNPACGIAIDRQTNTLVGDCDHKAYATDGTGLRHYPTAVENGKLFVDLNELGSTTTAKPTTTSSTIPVISGPSTTTNATG